jgi:hypothetical protein
MEELIEVQRADEPVQKEPGDYPSQTHQRGLYLPAVEQYNHFYLNNCTGKINRKKLGQP